MGPRAPDDRLALVDGERDVGPVCGYVIFEGVGGVGEAGAAQKDREFEDVMVGDGQAGEAQRSAQNEGDDQHERESGGRGPESAGGWGHRMAAFPSRLKDAHNVRAYPDTSSANRGVVA